MDSEFKLHKLRERLDRKLEQFLAERPRPDAAGVIQVDHRDVDVLQEIVRLLIDLKWNPDKSSGRAVHAIIYRSNNYGPVSPEPEPPPVRHALADPEAVQELLEALNSTFFFE